MERSWFRIDWYLEQLRGAQRTVWWYLARGRMGDRDAARRGLMWIADSLTPEALAQNGGVLDQRQAEVLRELLYDVAKTGDSPLLAVARSKKPRHRPTDLGSVERIWWDCVQLHQHLQANPGMSQTTAAELVIGTSGDMDPESLAKAYRKYRDTVEAFLLEDL